MLAAALIGLAGCGGAGDAGTRDDGGAPQDVPDLDSADADAAEASSIDTAGADTASPPDGSGLPDAVDAADAGDDDNDADAGDAQHGDGDGDGDGDDAADDAADDAIACPAGETCALPTSAGPCRVGLCDSAGACVATPIPGCCTAEADCAAYPVTSACEVYRCVFSQCTATTFPGCCGGAIGCDDGLPCTADACGADTGLCTHCPSGCSCAPPILEAGFDGATLGAGFTVVDDSSWDAVTWRPSQRRAVVPPGAAYLGRADCPNYYTGTVGADCAPADPVAQDGARVRAALLTPTFLLAPGAVSPRATVWLWADVEPVLGLGAAEPDVLRVTVEPIDGSPIWEVASSLAVGKRTDGGWRLLTVDLAPWAGRSVRLRFTFDSLDGQANAFEGVYLDALRVTEGCEGGGCCDRDADCADDTGDPCTVARCVPLTSGAGRTCAIVPAHPGAVCEPCATAASCVDDDPCTNDLCGADGACVHAAFCCLRRELWGDDFESGLVAWTVDDPVAGDGVAWTPSTHAFDGVGAAWFGAPETGTYATGAPVRGALASPPFALPAAPSGGGVELAFALDLDTEWSGAVGGYDNPAGVDRLVVTLLNATDEIVVWTSDAVGGTTDGEWVPVVADLTPWAGQTVQLRLTFDSVDGDANDHGGAWVDALVVRTACPAGG
jgi:hypothetical protein